MKFDPKSEEEVSGLLEPGTYDAEVLEAEEQVREKTGNPMIKLKVNVMFNGQNIHLYDYLLTDAMEFKLRHFAIAAGLFTKYQNGEIEDFDCQGRNVQVKIGVQKSDEYGKQNRILDYVQPYSEAKKPEPARETTQLMGVSNSQRKTAKDVDDDSIPF